MRSGYFYRHKRFMDVTFLAVRVGQYGRHVKFKAEWFVRGEPVNVKTNHDITPDKAREFYRL